MRIQKEWKKMLDFSKIIFLDGAMGTMLQQLDLPLGKWPEEINLTNPNEVINIHKQYIKAGAKIISANTFGANAYKIQGSIYSVEQIVQAGIENAKKAAENTDTLVAIDIGPIGKMLRPNGDMTFEQAYEKFRQMLTIGENCGADLVLFETISDLLEMKAAILAAKENTSLPILATMTFEATNRTFTGVNVQTMAATLEGLGVDAIGFNCSLGPKDMLPLVKELANYTNLPIIVKANAGLPDPNTNQYDITAQTFCTVMDELITLGASIIGGCCGTTPEYIKLLKQHYHSKKVTNRPMIKKSMLTSGISALEVNRICVVGERINPTGKKLFKEALKNKNISYILTQAVTQIEAGADILDVNVGLPGTDEKDLMITVIEQLQSIADVPLQIDSSDPEVIEAALRIYNGKPLVNSVNGEDEVLNRILPIVKKYGAAVIGLTLNQNGIPNKAEDRYQIARHIIEKADSYGIKREDIYIDCLTLTASVQQAEVYETLKAVQMVKNNLGVKTILGVSNISFGLPQRELLNKTFLNLALAHGLDLAIINPNNIEMTAAIDAFNVLYNQDKGAALYIAKHNTVKVENTVSTTTLTIDEAIKSGIKEATRTATLNLMKTTSPMDIVNNYLIPALDKVGTDFETNKIFLPQLMQSATAAQAGFDTIKQALSKKTNTQNISKGKIILATVKGDIHDIGKNIVKVILENYGYDIIDLGKDVPIEKIVNETLKNHIKLVGLSALMTTTIVNMAKTVQALRDAGADCKIMVGGAVLTEDFAKSIGADFYAKDAKQSADIAKKVFDS